MTGKIRILIGTVLLGLILVVVMLTACGPEEPIARSYQTKCYHEQGGDKWTCVSGGEIEMRTGATLDIQSGVTASINDLVISDTINIDDNVSTITGTQTLTPTASVYLFNPASTLTLTLATGGAAVGDFLWISNITSTASVVVVNTGATAGGSDRTIALDDTIGFIFANGKWLEAFYSDNS